ncbi:ASCH domain-containing protein [Priestia filamentosa]|uniref:ASCH domain-containing protein n=1 Tax=Priestia filamentosa TaxID=1402861 RepID=UPI001FB32CB5|nr:ASCH domain-containing protein [Priestia filamentosa]MED3728620.1 ASCH domain-containing protein [Priestia filamentosa]UOE63095.1 ASCH domain-containing protein [Priestia filamentosa]
MYWGEKKQPKEVNAWSFGGDPDGLADLVIKGVKTATCSGYLFYELEQEPLPKQGQYSIVLNSKEEPVAIIRISKVEVMPMNEVSEEFAFAEGEGDRSYRHWYSAHKQFFTNELRKIEKEFSDDMLLVLEQFELIHIKR